MPRKTQKTVTVYLMSKTGRITRLRAPVKDSQDNTFLVSVQGGSYALPEDLRITAPHRILGHLAPVPAWMIREGVPVAINFSANGARGKIDDKRLESWVENQAIADLLKADVSAKYEMLLWASAITSGLAFVAAISAYFKAASVEQIAVQVLARVAQLSQTFGPQGP